MLNTSRVSHTIVHPVLFRGKLCKKLCCLAQKRSGSQSLSTQPPKAVAYTISKLSQRSTALRSHRSSCCKAERHCISPVLSRQRALLLSSHSSTTASLDPESNSVSSQLLAAAPWPKGFTTPARMAASTAAAAKPNVSMLSPAARAEAPATEAVTGAPPALAALLCSASEYASPRTCTAQGSRQPAWRSQHGRPHVVKLATMTFR